MYVILEGIDTAGKSTQLDILKKNYPDAIFTKEPGGTELGLKLREMVLGGEASSSTGEMFLFLADRAEHNHKIVQKNPHKMIISDRGFLSGIAYAKNQPLLLSIDLNCIALNDHFPDKVIILKLPKATLEERLNSKTQDSIEQRGSEYLLSIQERMLEALELLNKKGGIHLDTLIIDASEPIEMIATKIGEFLEK